MNAALIAQLILTFGPQAITLIEKLSAVWSKPVLTPEEVKDICAVARKSYEAYIAEAKTAAGQT